MKAVVELHAPLVMRVVKEVPIPAIGTWRVILPRAGLIFLVDQPAERICPPIDRLCTTYVYKGQRAEGDEQTRQAITRDGREMRAPPTCSRALGKESRSITDVLRRPPGQSSGNIARSHGKRMATDEKWVCSDTGITTRS